ncbi:hypothetical protein [Thiocapsa imhoffii]|uniref:hypothetical protein n=1 Tax=Thiocapsa imhoffii TaxID=382777 RepID=UPI001903A488|nr:hypothetical protein [Thiocapsa imhoffii]
MSADPANPESWSGRDKLAVVIETAALNEQARSERGRRKGLYPEQIERWKEAAMAGSADPKKLTRDERAAWQHEQTQRVRDLEYALRRKENALDEAAALLVLKKQPRRSGGTTKTHEHARDPYLGSGPDRRGGGGRGPRPGRALRPLGQEGTSPQHDPFRHPPASFIVWKTSRS